MSAAGAISDERQRRLLRPIRLQPLLSELAVGGDLDRNGAKGCFTHSALPTDLRSRLELAELQDAVTQEMCFYARRRAACNRKHNAARRD